jgi:hypothetical protein
MILEIYIQYKFVKQLNLMILEIYIQYKFVKQY